MTRRHDRLIPLTHDHHHALAHARRLATASELGAEERSALAGEFLDFFHGETLTHFREEEESIFPLVVDDVECEGALTRVMLEHLRIHAGVRRVRTELDGGDVSAGSLTEVATMLEAHIRFEEKVLFPLIERTAGGALDRIALAPRQRGAPDRPG
jgi:iron-sulfur cluster repair protein YtfE (RIC family)